MKSKLNPFLLSGILASLIFLINCDNNSARSIKANMPAKKLDTTKLPPCSGDIMDLINERAQLVTNLNKKIQDSKGLDLDSTQKTALVALLDSVKQKSNDAYKAIKALKSSPEGCNSVSADNKKVPYAIESLKLENSNLTKQVAALVGAAISNLRNESMLTENQSYTIKSELARVMIKAKVDRMYILEGKIFDSADTAEELEALKAKKDKAFCLLENSMGEITATDEVSVMKIHSELSQDEKSASSSVWLAANGDQFNSFKCIVQNTSDVPTELRKIFGDLITLKNGVNSGNEEKSGD